MPTREEIARLVEAAFWGPTKPISGYDAGWLRAADAILALPSPAPVGEWRPIESAPTAGDDVLVAWRGQTTVRAPDGDYWRRNPHIYQGWMPLPEPPAQQPAAAEAREEGPMFSSFWVEPK